jgi:hypothetical protein
MKRTSVRVFLLIVLCLALIPIRQSQTVVAAASAITHSGERDLLYDPLPSTCSTVTARLTG